MSSEDVRGTKAGSSEAISVRGKGMDETSWFKGCGMQMTAWVGKMELVQMLEGSTHINESLVRKVVLIRKKPLRVKK